MCIDFWKWTLENHSESIFDIIISNSFTRKSPRQIEGVQAIVSLRPLLVKGIDHNCRSDKSQRFKILGQTFVTG